MLVTVLFIAQFLLLVTVVGYAVWLMFLLLPAFTQGAPYVATTHSRVAVMVRLAKLAPGELAYDLGSGDGRLLVAAAKVGAHSQGYEVNLPLVLATYLAAYRAGVGKLVTVRWGSFWRQNISQADVVFVYGLSTIMPKLAQKFRQELAPGTRIISAAFELPGFTAEASEGGVYRYVVH